MIMRQNHFVRDTVAYFTYYGAVERVVIDGIEKTNTGSLKVTFTRVCDGTWDVMHLGDAGVPGHQYDNRPPCFFTTEAEAIEGAPFNAWFLRDGV